MAAPDERNEPAAVLTGRRRFDALTQLIREVVVVLDEHLVITYVSPSLGEVLGWNADDWLGERAPSLAHPDDLAGALELARRMRDRPDGTYQASFRLRSTSGEWRWMDAMAANLLDDPEVRGLVLTLRDVTPLRRTQEALRRLEHLSESTTDLIAITGADGTPTYVNGAGLDLLGIGADELAGFDPRRAYTEASWEVVTTQAVPAAMRDGHWRGELDMRSACGEVVPVSQVLICRRGADGSIEFFGSLSRDMRERRTLELHLRRQANHDALTGLPSRSPIVEHLGSALDRATDGERVAVVFVDLDRFKVVNDSLGHHAGDRVLCEIARRLVRSVGPDDLAGRFGGDEFVVVRDAVSGVDDALALARSIRDGITGSVEVHGGDVHLTTSIGVALAEPGATADDVLRDAEVALYEAKAQGRDAIVRFDQRLRDRAVARLETERDLRRALCGDEFRLRYQPIIDLVTGEVRAFEALIRWEHPTRGLLLPVQFLGVAEETGLMVDIGRWVVAEACREAGTWVRDLDPGDDRPPPSIFVNLSARELLEQDLPALVAACVRSAGLRPLQLHLEITEQALMTDVDTAGTIVRDIREGGVRFALDDFGTGQSSLAYLRQFPIGVVKIDRSFVVNLRDPVTTAIIEGVVALADRLGTTTIAEGIETPEQAATLRSLGCGWGQGNLFSVPLAAADLAGLATPDARLPLPA